MSNSFTYEDVYKNLKSSTRAGHRLAVDVSSSIRPEKKSKNHSIWTLSFADDVVKVALLEPGNDLLTFSYHEGIVTISKNKYGSLLSKPNGNSVRPRVRFRIPRMYVGFLDRGAHGNCTTAPGQIIFEML